MAAYFNKLQTFVTVQNNQTGHNILIQCRGIYIGMKNLMKNNKMFENDIFRNNLQNNLVVHRCDF